MDVTSEAQVDLPGSERAETGSLVFPQQEWVYPNPASSRIGGLPSWLQLQTSPPRSPGAVHLLFPSLDLLVPEFTI